MINLNYDLHLHSCLSPCGDNDMTPNNIVGMSVVKELDVIAVTDHNSCKNCPAVKKIADHYGIIAIPGMELCTVEEVHVLCLFKKLDDAMNFDSYVSKHIIAIPNNEEVFGKQLICNEDNEIIGKEENLLINSTDISFDKVYDIVESYNGIMIPAHIEKSSTSLMSNLGFVPPNSKFKCVELKNMSNLHELRRQNPYLNNCRIITDSDAHYLEHINEPINSILCHDKSIDSVFEALQTI